MSGPFNYSPAALNSSIQTQRSWVYRLRSVKEKKPAPAFDFIQPQHSWVHRLSSGKEKSKRSGPTEGDIACRANRLKRIYFSKPQPAHKASEVYVCR